MAKEPSMLSQMDHKVEEEEVVGVRQSAAESYQQIIY